MAPCPPRARRENALRNGIVQGLDRSHALIFNPHRQHYVQSASTSAFGTEPQRPIAAIFSHASTGAAQASKTTSALVPIFRQPRKCRFKPDKSRGAEMMAGLIGASPARGWRRRAVPAIVVRN
jgi:hypothetical protein